MTKTLAILSGYFNPLHIGHLDMIKAGKELGDHLVVIVNNDNQQLLKKGKIIMNENERAEIVSAIRYVDEVYLSTDQDLSISESLEHVVTSHPEFDKYIFGNGGDINTPEVIRETPICEKYNIEIRYDVGGTKKANSSSNINQLRGAE